MMISNYEIHIWYIYYDQLISSVDSLWNILSLDEQVRSKKLYSKKSQNECIIRRGALRLLLGEYLSISPFDIKLSYNNFGKPTLDKLIHTDNIHFNLSCSTDLIMYGFCKSKRIGVDIEKIKTVVEAEWIIQNYFSTADYEMYKALSADKKRNYFLFAWTTKEAIVKGIGNGLSTHKIFDVFNISNHSLNKYGFISYSEGWNVKSTRVEFDYISAIAVEDAYFEVKHQQWSY